MQSTINRCSTVQAVLQELRRDIIIKKLENDTPVTELAFADYYGCSRAALRGALTALEQEGLIRVMPNGTKRICSLSTEDVNHLYELRSYVECSAVQQILQKKSVDLSKLVQVIEKAKETENFLDSDALFHETLIELSGNKALMQTWKTFVPVTRELFLLNFSLCADMRDSLEKRHMHIIKLLFEKNAQAIEELSSHIEEARQISVGNN